jgi:PAS domain S-box-containing protein
MNRKICMETPASVPLDLEAVLPLFVNSVQDYALLVLDTAGCIVSWNQGAQLIKGYRSEEILGRHFSCFYPLEDIASGRPQYELECAAATGRFEDIGYRLRKDGSRFVADVVITALRAPDGTLLGYGKITRDITERKRSEEQSRRSHRLEAIGQLAGGLAHDFNNLLCLIINNIEFLNDAMGENAAHLALGEEVLNAALSGAALTHRLLAFARRQPLRGATMDLNTYLQQQLPLLQRTVENAVVVSTRFAPELWPSHADADQIGDAMLNLCINARDAMPAGGRLIIETANRHVSEADAAHLLEMAAGDYVVLSVTDTGRGMTADAVARAIEPFFTTKPLGSGTGLGLSMIYGFAKQSGGHLQISSTLGVGTTVNLYLPRGAAAPAKIAVACDATGLPGGSERILLVDDHVGIRSSTGRHLTALGYSVTAASNGIAALDLLRSGEPIDLLFTDVVMPGGLNGYELADAARQTLPGIAVLLCTGYADQPVSEGTRRGQYDVLYKPFRRKQLAETVRGMLDGAR